MNKSTSLYLDGMRLTAALTLFFVHANYLLPDEMQRFWWLCGLGAESGTIFFVLSGFVIAHVVHTRELHAADYLTARFARLYSGVLPALLITVVLDHAGAALAPDEYAASMKTGVWGIAASLLFANEVWFAAIRPLSNTPYWSLAYEFWFYMIYAAGHYIPGRGRKCAAVLLLCLICGPKILLLLPVWLLGVAAHALSCRVKLAGPVAVLLAVASAGGLVLLAGTGAKAQWLGWTIDVLGEPARKLGPSIHVLYRFVFGVLVAFHVLAMVTVAPMLGIVWRVAGTALRATSAYTFAIYLFHFPTLKFLAAATAAAGLETLRAPVVLALSLALIGMFDKAIGPLKPLLKYRLQRGFRKLAGIGTAPGQAPAATAIKSLRKAERASAEVSNEK